MKAELSTLTFDHRVKILVAFQDILVYFKVIFFIFFQHICLELKNMIKVKISHRQYGDTNFILTLNNTKEEDTMCKMLNHNRCAERNFTTPKPWMTNAYVQKCG